MLTTSFVKEGASVPRVRLEMCRDRNRVEEIIKNYKEVPLASPTLTFRTSPIPLQGNEHSHTDTTLTVLSQSQCGLVNLTESHYI